MEDEFERVMDFLSLESSEKEAKLDDIFKNSIEFFEHFKHVQKHGSKDEVDSMRQKLEKMYVKVKEESGKASEKTGLTHEQIQELASDPKNFSQNQWEFLQNAKDKLSTQNQELVKKAEEHKKNRMKVLSKANKKKKIKKKDWMRS